MIVIDGRDTDLEVGNFANLEEIIVSMVEKEDLQNRIVTDVIVNGEAFSELYPHQAEDIAASEVHDVEMRSISLDEMARATLEELPKVIHIICIGGAKVASLLRGGDVTAGLEVFQDLVDVTRNCLTMMSALRDNCTTIDRAPLDGKIKELSGLVDEMIGVIEDNDWLLLADLSEFELVPMCKTWDDILKGLGRCINVKAA